jgi:hypothetical protein
MKKTKGKFKIEIRKTCKVCGEPIVGKRFRSYCSSSCRNKFFNKKYSAEHTRWQRERNNKIAEKPSINKVQCLICKRWYVQVCTHTLQVHGVTGREYREAFDLEVKRGVVPAWYRKMKGEQALENETYKNLEKGKKFRFKKGQEGVGVYKRSPITLERIKNLKQNYGNKPRRSVHTLSK